MIKYDGSVVCVLFFAGFVATTRRVIYPDKISEGIGKMNPKPALSTALATNSVASRVCFDLQASVTAYHHIVLCF